MIMFRMGCGSSKEPVIGIKNEEAVTDVDNKEEVVEGTKSEGKEPVRI